MTFSLKDTFLQQPPSSVGPRNVCPRAGSEDLGENPSWCRGTLPAAFIFWVGFLHKDKAPRTKSGLGAKDCAQKSAGNASPTPYGFTPKAHGILWGFTASPSFWDSLHAPIHSNLPKAHQATKYLCFFSVLGVFLAPH